VSLKSYLKRPYVLTSVWIAIFTIAGFWATYYSKLPFGVSDHGLVTHLHAVVFTGWLVLLIVQTVFAAQGKIKQHMALGTVGIYWGCALIIMGLWIALQSFQHNIAAQGMEAASRTLAFPLFDMLLFTPAFALAISFRKTPRHHKRLMLVAVTVMLVAPGARLLIALDKYSDSLLLIIWLLPLVFAQISDLVRRKGLSPIYLTAMIIIPLSYFGRLSIRETEPWATFTQSLATVLS
jgi:hypothetical protein